LVELLDRLEVGRTDILGVSFGGFVALRLALRYPGRVRKLVLASPAGLAPTEEEQLQAARNFGFPLDISEILIPADVDALKRFLDRVFLRPRYIPRFVLRQLLRDEFWRNATAKRRICAGARQEMLRPAQLRAIRAETLLIWGAHDPLLPPSIGERMVRALPRGRLVRFERSAHPSMLEEPLRFNREVLQFLNGLPHGPREGVVDRLTSAGRR
jgi:2-hydroxymuconate-semialdehyde hydrolase